MKKHNKLKSAAALLTAALCVFMAGCGAAGNGGTPAAPEKTPEELVTAYQNAIIDARGGIENCQNFLTNTSDFKSYFGMTDEEITESGMTDEDMTNSFNNTRDMQLDTLGLTAEDMSAYVISVSMMNIRADSIVVAHPAEGKADAVKTALEQYVANVQKSFEQYLPDQYEVAKTAVIETLGDGTYVLVMCEDGANVMQSIKTALSK